MNNYYYIPPKKPKIPKPVTIFDLVLLIAAVILGCILIPIDLSAGISGTSYERAKGIEKLVSENGVEKGYFDTLFETGTREPFVQADKKYGTYLIYKNGKYESFNYEKGQKTIFGSSSRQNVPAGIISSSGLVSETEDGIYYENMKGFYGCADIEFTDSLFTDGTFDFEKTTDLLANGTDENISLADATAIYHYMKNGTIVGYADGVVWYVARNGQDGYHLIRDYADKPIALAYDLGKYGKNVYMINNTYLMYEVDGDLYIYYNDEYNRRLDCGEDIVGLDYAIKDDGKITIFAYTPSKLFRLDLTGDGVEYENLRIDDINNPDGMYITKEWNKTLCWLRYGKEYSIYES